MEKAWWKEAVVYQVYPRSFYDSNGDGIGDLNGITEKMDYLKELGIDVIWLSPVYESPNDDNGYDISNYREIMKEFGTMEDYDRMLAAAHERGIKIVMDLVVNHTSDEHPWFVESRSSKDSKYRDYYFWRDGKDGKEPNNWGSCFSGSAWEYDETTEMYYLHLFSKKQPDLNWDNPKVRDAVFEMMDWWCQKGIDGFRMDVISMISKVPGLPDGEKRPGASYGSFGPWVQNGPHVHEYIQEMNQRVLSKYDLLTVGETAGVTVDEAKKYASLDGKELSMVFHFEHMNLEEGAGFQWNGRRIDLVKLKKIMTKWQVELEGKAWNSLYWCNHDQPRMVSRIGDDSPKYRELTAKTLATCIHMMKGTPYIYQGEELGMTNVPFKTMDDFRDIESLNLYEQEVKGGRVDHDTMMEYLCHMSRDNARTPVQWDDSENAGFTTGTPWIMVNPNYKEINAKEQMSREDSVFHHYQKLIALRKEYDIIPYGIYEELLPEDAELYVYKRTLEEKTLIVICNFSEKERTCQIPKDIVLKNAKVLIANYKDVKVMREMQLRPYESLAVYLEDK